MASQITNYQCPHCTGPLHFDSASGKLLCEYCEGAFTVEEVEALYQSKNEQAEEAKAPSWNTDEAGTEWGEDGTHLRTYQCPSCGAVLDCDETTAAAECPYCGNPTIIPGQLSGSRKPDFVIPFKVKRSEALNALRNHYGGKRLLPKLFSEENHLEKIQGIYVPFWLYDGQADCAVTFSGTRTRVYRTGNTEVTEVSRYQLYREGSVQFEHLPADASSKMPDDLMDSLEPYDMSELKPFSLSYLPGYLADHFDVEKEDCAMRAAQRAKNTARSVLADTASTYDSLTPLSQSIRLKPGGTKCALLPVWLLTTRWNGQTYTFAMNGQTGKLVGDLPVDPRRARALRLKYAAGIAAVLYALKWLIVLL